MRTLSYRTVENSYRTVRCDAFIIIYLFIYFAVADLDLDICVRSNYVNMKIYIPRDI